MAGRIPSDFIQDLVARSDIVDIIDSRVKLKKAGRNYQACCPFHNEKTPSFSVSQEKQFYYCFGCGAKGNVISFLMDYDKLEFVEAVEELASRYGIEVPREKGQAPSKNTKQAANLRQLDHDTNERVSQYYESELKNNTNSQRVIDYLKGRGLSGSIVKQWNIGFAPDAWDGVLKRFGKTPNDIQRLIDLKLVNQNEQQRRFDFFRNRIMFPIRDKRGKVVAFGGRIIDGDGPKYLNSPETRIFHKSAELYGFYQVRKAYNKIPQMLVVEGYMDVVALSQFDINYAVASLGTATTSEQIQMMFRATDQVVCCYDGDRAGRQAAFRTMENALPYLQDGKIMKFLFLPDGEDPDTMVRKTGKEAFEDLVSSAKPLSTFLFDTLKNEHDIASIEGKAALKANAEKLIEQIAGENQKDLMLTELAKICGKSDSHDHVSKTKAANRAVKFADIQQKPPTVVSLSPLRMMVRILLESPRVASTNPLADPSLLKPNTQKGLPFLVDLHQKCLSTPNLTTAMLLETYRDHPHEKHVLLLVSQPLFESIDLNEEYVSCFKKLVQFEIQARIDELMSKPQQSPQEKEELKVLLKQTNK